ncbi:hypothetical protein [Vibrio splendidus]|uniref:hypothetical protein n=1 Tax=Vibrio splendidus TaxID=29497 RepID=UPI003D10463D
MQLVMDELYTPKDHRYATTTADIQKMIWMGLSLSLRDIQSFFGQLGRQTWQKYRSRRDAYEYDF